MAASRVPGPDQDHAVIAGVVRIRAQRQRGHPIAGDDEHRGQEHSVPSGCPPATARPAQSWALTLAQAITAAAIPGVFILRAPCFLS